MIDGALRKQCSPSVRSCGVRELWYHVRNVSSTIKCKENNMKCDQNCHVAVSVLCQNCPILSPCQQTFPETVAQFVFAGGALQSFLLSLFFWKFPEKFVFIVSAMQQFLLWIVLTNLPRGSCSMGFVDGVMHWFCADFVPTKLSENGGTQVPSTKVSRSQLHESHVATASLEAWHCFSVANVTQVEIKKDQPSESTVDQLNQMQECAAMKQRAMQSSERTSKQLCSASNGMLDCALHLAMKPHGNNFVPTVKCVFVGNKREWQKQSN